MRDNATPHERQTGSPAAPLSYRPAGADQPSQWITDDGPGGRWLVGCLVVLSILGAIVGSAVGLINLFEGGC
jgi:hypothetical protein